MKVGFIGLGHMGGRPLFDVLGQKAFPVGETPRAANLVKLSGNFLLASVIEALGEAMALVGKAGIDRHRYLDLLTSTLFTAPAYKTYGGLIADEKFEPAGFAASLGHKDIRLTLAAAEDLRVPMLSPDRRERKDYLTRGFAGDSLAHRGTRTTGGSSPGEPGTVAAHLEELERRGF